MEVGTTLNQRTDIDLAGLERKLLDEKKLLLTDEKNTEDARKAVELDQTTVGRLSRMDAMQVQAMALETERRRVVELERIEAALKRMDDGDYGYCIACDADIPPKRLDLDPATPICVNCAEKSER